MQKKYLTFSVVLALSLGVFFIGKVRTISAAPDLKVIEWNGTWRGSDDAIMSISEKDRFLEIAGKDNASIYNCSGILEGSSDPVVRCYGSGVNHKINKRFVYRSQLKLVKSGQELQESWECGFSDGDTIKWIKGEVTFKREKAESRER
jgi:hypothetical protein